MKRTVCVGLGLLLFLTAGRALYAQSAVSLDAAITQGAGEIEARLTQGIKVVVLNFNSSSKRLSDYVLDEMMTALVKSGKITVVDRANLELIQREMDFQQSGEVSDNSAQEIGQKLGAQSIVSGSIEDMDSYYRIRFRTIEVVSAAIQVLSSINVQKDKNIASLMNSGAARTGSQPSQTTPNILVGAMNLALGLGSYMQGDIGGGLFITAGYAVGIGLLVWEVAVLKYEDDLAGIPGPIGIGVLVGTAAYGFARPFIYSRNHGLALILDHLDIVPVSDGQRIGGLGISYTYSF